MQISKINLFGLNRFNQTKTQINPTKFRAENDVFKKSDIAFTSNDEDEIIKYHVNWNYQLLTLPNVSKYVVYKPIQKKLNILKGSERHLQKLAESLCMYPNSDIINFSKISRPFGRGIDEQKSIKAYSRLIPYIVAQREKLAYLYREKEKFDSKAEQGKLSIENDEDFQLFYINEEIKRIERRNVKAESLYLKPEYFEAKGKPLKKQKID